MSGGTAVVIPAWNLGDELNACVDSVLNQEVQARVMIVDNATEQSLPALPDVPSVEVVHLPRRLSVGAARNEGLARVQEEFVMFLDGDDLLLPGALAFLHEQISARPEASVVAGSFEVWSPKSGRRVLARWPFDYCYRLNRYPRAFALANCARNMLPITGPVLMRTSAARACGGFADANWAEDWALGAVLAFAGVPILSRRVCGLYRVDSDRFTLSDRKELKFRPAWAGRRIVRQRLRASRQVPRPVRACSRLLVMPHLYFTLSDLRVPRQRID